jgi:hypothetical protein
MGNFFKAALTELAGNQVAIIWLDISYLNKTEEIKKQIKFFKELLDCPNVCVMILDESEKPIYYGKPEIVEKLKLNVWKKFPWQSYSLSQS